MLNIIDAVMHTWNLSVRWVQQLLLAADQNCSKENVFLSTLETLQHNPNAAFSDCRRKVNQPLNPGGKVAAEHLVEK